MSDIIPLADSFVRYTIASSTTGPFTIPFQFLEDEDLEVLVNDATPASNYTIARGAPVEYAGYNGGTITFASALAVNDVLTIARQTRAKRNSNLTGASLTANNINVEYGKIIYILQELRRDLQRALLAEYGGSGSIDNADLAAVLAIANEIEEVASLDTEVAALAAITTSIVTVATNIDDIIAAAGGVGGSTSVWKQSVRVATTQAGTLATDFEAGDSIDGVTLVEGDRILLRNQTASAQNGIYTVNASGAPTRATDAANDADVLNGIVTYVREGTVQSGKLFALTTIGAITVGTTQLTFSEISGSGSGSSDWKDSVRVATTAALSLANDIGVGDTVDGIVLAEGDRVLVKDQAASAENGIYVVPASGFPNRAEDFDASAGISTGNTFFVEEGTANAGGIFILTTLNPTIPGNLSFTRLATGNVSGSGVTYASVADMKAGPAGTSASDKVSLTEEGREGEWKWLSGDRSALVTLDPNNGLFIAPSSDATGASGVWARMFTGPASAKWFNVLGNGVADDTSAIQAAVNTGYDIHFPGVDIAGGEFYNCSTVVSVSTAGQVFTGDGKKSEIRQSGSDANSNLFSITATDVEFHRLSVRPGIVTNSTYQGFAFYFANADRAKVTGCYGTQHRRGIVMLNNSSDSEVHSNIFENSVVTAGSLPDVSDTGCDIWLVNGTSDCLVHSNILHLGCGSGISVQTITRTNCNRNLIYNNIVTEMPAYGIYLYCGDITDQCDQNIVSDNIIDTVYGFVESIVAGGNTFGAGIYFQATGHNLCTGNSVKNTNVNTDMEVLAPAAIGSINNRSTQIVGNKIWDPIWYGIMVADPNQNNNFADALVKVNDNDVYNPTRDGIYSKDCPHVQIHDNDVINGAVRGIFVRNVGTTTTDHVSVAGNYVKDCSNAGAEINDASVVVCSNNQWLDCGTRGIVFSNCDSINHTGDVSDRAGTWGVYYLNCEHVRGSNVNVYDAGQGLSQRAGFTLSGCTDLKMNGCNARIRSGTAMQYGINFSGSGNSELHFTSCEWEGTVTDVTGTAPANIITTDCVADLQDGFRRKSRSISGTTLNVNRFDRHLHIGAGTIQTINNTNSKSGQMIFATFSGVVTFDTGVDNVFCNNDSDQICGQPGSTRIVAAWLSRTGNNWIIQT